MKTLKQFRMERKQREKEEKAAREIELEKQRQEVPDLRKVPRGRKHMMKMWEAARKAREKRRAAGDFTYKRKYKEGKFVLKGNGNRNRPKYDGEGNLLPKFKKFTPGFLRDMDQRGSVYLRVKKNFDVIAKQMGGYESLSLLQLTLVERMVFLMEMMEQFEGAMIGSDKKSVDLMDKYVKSLNGLQTLAKALGVKKVKIAGDLKAYVSKKRVG